MKQKTPKLFLKTRKRCTYKYNKYIQVQIKNKKL